MANNFKDHLQSIIRKHVSAAVEAAAHEAVDAYRAMLTRELGDTTPHATTNAAAAPSHKATPAATPRAKVGRPKKFVRRSSDQINASVVKVLAFVEKHPGLRSEQIAKKMGGDGEGVSDALKRLRTEKKVKTHGVKRAMTYSL